MIAVDGRHIYINRGDTGAVKIRAVGYDFQTEDDEDDTVIPDKCVFTLKSPDGSVVIEKAFSLDDDGAFEVAFLNADTRNLTPGEGYYWGITYYIHPYYQTGNPIPYNGNIVYTPTKETLPFTVWPKA